VYFCTIRLYNNLQRSNRLGQEQTVRSEDLQRENGNDQNSSLKFLKDLMVDYFAKTTIQGFNYVAQAELSLFERLWWAIVVALSIFCCGSLISNVIRHHEHSPVIISYSDIETPISEVIELSPKSSI
jgi:Trk-type K+ transport system membrane component